jgi:hypothetical protein
MRLSVWTWHAKRWSGQCYSGHLHILASWDLSFRWRILWEDRDVSGVLSTLSLWKICFVNIWCTFEFSTIRKCVHTMNSKIVKYIWLLFKCIYVNIIMWIWFLYEFESCMNLNLKYSKWDVICIFQMVSASFPYPDDFDFGWLKLADTKDNFSNPVIFDIDCVRTVDTNNRSLVPIDINR